METKHAHTAVASILIHPQGAESTAIRYFLEVCDCGKTRVRTESFSGVRGQLTFATAWEPTPCVQVGPDPQDRR